MPPKSPVRALPASPPLISLLSSAEILPEQDIRWEAGIAYEPEICGSSKIGSYPACDANGVTIQPGSTQLEIEPIIHWAEDSCSSFGFASRDWQGRARRKLQSCESNLIEQELWRGTLSRANSWPNRYLASADAVEVTVSPTDPITALSCLEQALASCNCGSQGMIHATPQVITHWISSWLVHRDGSRLMTELGTIVVPGSGYDGSGPGESPNAAPIDPVDGSIWAYATSKVHVRLGPISILPGDQSQALDRASNTLTYWAQRVAVVGWDCCHLAAAVDLAMCHTGS